MLAFGSTIGRLVRVRVRVVRGTGAGQKERILSHSCIEMLQSGLACFRIALFISSVLLSTDFHASQCAVLVQVCTCLPYVEGDH